MSKKRVTRTALIPKLREHKGNLAACGRHFHVTRERIRQIVAEDEELSRIVFEERESFLDVAENALYDAIIDGNIVATIFFLKTQGKSRGYIERAELSGPNGLPFQAQIEVDLFPNGLTDKENPDQALVMDRTTAGFLAE